MTSNHDRETIIDAAIQSGYLLALAQLKIAAAMLNEEPPKEKEEYDTRLRT